MLCINPACAPPTATPACWHTPCPGSAVANACAVGCEFIFQKRCSDCWLSVACDCWAVISAGDSGTASSDAGWSRCCCCCCCAAEYNISNVRSANQKFVSIFLHQKKAAQLSKRLCCKTYGESPSQKGGCRDTASSFGCEDGTDC